MWINGQNFTTELVGRIQALVDGEEGISVREVSRRVCEWLEWRAPNGKLQDMSCRKALLELKRRKKLRLPESKETYGFEKRNKPAIEASVEVAEVCCSLRQLGEVSLVRVPSRYSKKSEIWKELIERYHYLGLSQGGARLRYLVESEKCGWLGAIGFSAATRKLKARDEWIGWTPRARHYHLEEVLNQSRFLILPTVKVRNLATHVLSLSVRTVQEDWEEQYGYRPVLLETFVDPTRFKGTSYRAAKETFVDPTRFKGTSYRAANWEHIGQSSGRKKVYPNGKRSDEIAKDIYVYPLTRQSRPLLCEEPPRRLDPDRVPREPADWVERELGGMEVYDSRLIERVKTLTRDLADQQGAPISQACNGSQSKTQAAYRLMENPEVTMDRVVKAHTEATIHRIREHSVVLSVQDTSTLNYTSHAKTEGMGPINTKQDKGVGLIVHDTMGFTTQGTPLGLLDLQCWARDPKEAGKRERRKELPIEQKESMKWLRSYQATAEAQKLCSDTLLVSVGDRESDIYELFCEAAKQEDGPALLVRAERSRRRTVEEDLLWDRMEEEAVAGYIDVAVAGKAKAAARNAKVSVRFAEVVLNPPKKKDLPPVRVWAVYAKEVDPPATVKKPLQWLLLTTVEVNTFEDACERIEWYCIRWCIESYHRILKSGCRIEDRRLHQSEEIKTCLALDMVVAWHTFWITKQCRETPDATCEIIFTEEQWKPLYLFHKGPPLPNEPPTAIELVFMLAALGGFLGRKSDRFPGPTYVWRGLIRLADIILGFKTAQALYNNRSP
jgi:hypothetical protein